MADRPNRAEAGKWFARLQHTEVGAIDFTAVHKPQVTLLNGGALMHLTIDENAYLMSTAGLKVLWTLYVPRPGELPPRADFDICETDKAAGGPVAGAAPGAEAPGARPPEQRPLGRNWPAFLSRLFLADPEADR